MKHCLPYDCVQTHDQNLYQVAECTCGQISVAEYNLSSINRLDEKNKINEQYIFVKTSNQSYNMP